MNIRPPHSEPLPAGTPVVERAVGEPATGDSAAGEPCPPAETLGAYHDGELAPDRAAAVASHLDGCPACRQEWRRGQALTDRLATARLDTGRLAPAGDEESPPASAVDQARERALDGATGRWQAAIRRQLQEQGRQQRGQSVLRLVRRLTAVAAAVLVAGGVFLWQRPDDLAAGGERGNAGLVVGPPGADGGGAGNQWAGRNALDAVIVWRQTAPSPAAGKPLPSDDVGNDLRLARWIVNDLSNRPARAIETVSAH